MLDHVQNVLNDLYFQMDKINLDLLSYERFASEAYQLNKVDEYNSVAIIYINIKGDIDNFCFRLLNVIDNIKTNDTPDIDVTCLNYYKNILDDILKFRLELMNLIQHLNPSSSFLLRIGIIMGILYDKEEKEKMFNDQLENLNNLEITVNKISELLPEIKQVVQLIHENPEGTNYLIEVISKFNDLL